MSHGVLHHAIAWLMVWSTAVLVPSIAPAAGESTGNGTALDDTTAVFIAIKARQFEPETIMLTAGKPARLVFRNLDSELHAVVPKQFLSGVTVSVSGNGAPEFDEDGFKRVIIPSDGQVEIRFTPKRTGIYHYVCDMPGHEMRARIEVHE